VAVPLVERLTGASKNTVVKLLVELGEACSKYQSDTIKRIHCKRVQCDEIWSFIGAKEKNTTPETKAAGWGDVWTSTALDADSKLTISFWLGDRSLATAHPLHRRRCGQTREPCAADDGRPPAVSRGG